MAAESPAVAAAPVPAGDDRSAAAPWSDPDLLFDLVDGLRADGGKVGVGEYIAVQQVLLAAAARGLPVERPEDVQRLIAPLLCTTPDEQADFALHFGAWLQRAGGPPAAPVKQSASSLDRELREIEIKDRLRWMWAAAAVLLVALLVTALLLPLFRPGIYGRLLQRPPTPGPTVAAAATPAVTRVPMTNVPTMPAATLTRMPTPTPPGEDSGSGSSTWAWGIFGTRLFWMVAALAAPPVLAGTWVARRLWYRHRAALFLQRRKTDEPPDITRVRVTGVNERIYDTGEMHAVARLLRRRTPTPSAVMDVDRTLARTLEHGGWLTPVFEQRRQSPEYLVLVSRLTYRDHQAHQADALLEALPPRTSTARATTSRAARSSASRSRCALAR